MLKGTIEEWTLVHLGNGSYHVVGKLNGSYIRTSVVTSVDFAAGEARTLSGSIYKLGTPAIV